MFEAPPRSFLFVPGSREAWFLPAAASGADALFLDLEDSVPPPERIGARRKCAAFLELKVPIPVFVRISAVDATTAWSDDLDAVVVPGLAGIQVPKVETEDAIRLADERIGELEQQRGMAPGSVRLVLVPETALGIHRAYELLSSTARTVGTIFAGAQDGDLSTDLGASWTPGSQEMLYARSRLLLEARAADLTVILDSAYTALEDEGGLRADSLAGKRLGYTGRVAVHPRQVGVINEVFTPTAAELAYYRGMIEALEAAAAEGAAAVRYRGKLVDSAMARRAKDVVATGERLGLKPDPG